MFLGRTLDVTPWEVLVGVDPAYLSQTSLYDLTGLPPVRSYLGARSLEGSLWFITF